MKEGGSVFAVKDELLSEMAPLNNRSILWKGNAHPNFKWFHGRLYTEIVADQLTPQAIGAGNGRYK